MHVRQALATASSALGLERLDAQLLLLKALDKTQADRAWLIAHDDDALPADAEMRYIELARRRAAGAPLAYLVGEKEFHGLMLQVDGRVLIPRPDTETLVEWSLECLQGLDVATPDVIDLGTGSGAIALALAKALPHANVTALDVSQDALAVAEANAKRQGLHQDQRQGTGVHFILGAWLTGLREKFHLIVSNPPYIAEGDTHLQALGHEPRLALTSGPDGLDAIRAIIQQAPANLRPGGWLLLEHGWDQAAAARALLAAAGFTQVQSRRDLPGIERCSGGQWPGEAA
jgi:release factor glutamine methyltransferase